MLSAGSIGHDVAPPGEPPGEIVGGPVPGPGGTHAVTTRAPSTPAAVADLRNLVRRIIVAPSPRPGPAPGTVLRSSHNCIFVAIRRCASAGSCSLRSAVPGAAL